MILCIFGIRIVFFRGQVQKSTAWASANAFASVPLEIQTTRTAMAYAPTSKSTGGRVHASSANAMSFMPFFFVQFSKVNFFCCESVLSASATFINIPRFLPFVNTFYKVFTINMELFSLLGFYMLFLKCLKS